MKKKVLLMGLASSGKSTIIRLLTEGRTPSKDDLYDPSIDYMRYKQIIDDTEVTYFDHDRDKWKRKSSLGGEYES